MRSQGAGAQRDGGLSFQEAIGLLFSLAFSAKFGLKATGVLDYALAPLECLWFGGPPAPPAEWHWRLMLRLPTELTVTLLKPARQALLAGKGQDAQAVKRLVWREGRALQCLHKGPYEKLGETYARLQEFAAQRRLVVAGPGHEIYLSDPRRAAPARLRTIVRLPVKSKKA